MGGSMAVGRMNAGAAAIRERIYVVGGNVRKYEATNSAERFGAQADIRLCSRYPGRICWATLPPMAYPRCGVSTSVITSRLYVSGGMTTNGIFSTVERFDPALGTWELLQALLPRLNFTTAVLRDRLFVCGGRAANDGKKVLTSVECYDPDTDTWEESTPMLNARCGAKAASISGCLYVFGGFASEEHAPLTSTERFDPATKRWEVC